MLKMSQKRIVKISLLGLIVSLMLLVGFTYAWFSAEVVSKNNIIKIGNLGVQMEYSDGSLDENNSEVWIDVEKSEKPMFNLEYLEPGYRAVRYLKISNTGNLAFQYQLDLESHGDLQSLGDVIDVYLIKDSILKLDSFNPARMAQHRLGSLSEVVSEGVSLNKAIILSKNLKASDNLPDNELDISEEVAYATLVLRMVDDKGNMAMGESLDGGFDVKLSATQISFEKDGIDTTYDLGATLNN